MLLDITLTFNIVIICLLIIAIGLLIYLLITKNKSKEEKSIDFTEVIKNQNELKDVILDKLSLDKQKLNNQEMFNNLNTSLNKNINDFKIDTINLLNQNIKNITDEFNKINTNITNNLNENQLKMNNKLEEKIKEISNNFTVFSDRVIKFLQDEIKKLNDQVKGQLDEGFKQTNDSFKSMLESITKITEAQKQIEKVQDNVVSLQNILSNQKQRGIFGEVQLSTILSNVFGDLENNNVYELQYKFDNGFIADAVIKCPDPVGLLSVDSKFPLENYLKMQNTTNEIERKEYSGLFKQDIKKKINDISLKYIINGVTSEQAIMFIPSEAVFAEINANHSDLILEAQKKRVWLTSPTTFIAFLTTVATLLQNIKQSKNILVIKENIKALAIEFDRYKERWNDLEKDINKVSEGVKKINTTSQKISNKFEQITKIPDSKIEEIEVNEDLKVYSK